MIQNLKKKFLNREQIRGAMIFDFFSPGIPYAIKNSGCEFAIYDMEHGGLTLDKFKELSLISKGIGLSPMIRIPEISYNYIARSLDLGANGIMIPMVNDQKEALEIVKYSKYPPLGRRGAGFGFAHNEYKKENPIDVMQNANKTLINIIQIENESGLENVQHVALQTADTCTDLMETFPLVKQTTSALAAGAEQTPTRIKCHTVQRLSALSRVATLC